MKGRVGDWGTGREGSVNYAVAGFGGLPNAEGELVDHDARGIRMQTLPPSYSLLATLNRVITQKVAKRGRDGYEALPLFGHVA